MSPAAVAGLQATLSELDRLIQREHGELHARFRPGLSDRELESLAASLQPYYLPAELIALYRWHDGWQDSVNDEYRFLLPDASFSYIAEAIKQYEIWWGALGSDGWHPLWFPAFGDQSGELVTLQFEPNEPAGPVFAFHSDLDLYTSYDSVTTLFATTLECWRAGVMPHDPSYLPREIREIALRHNPLSRTPDGGYRREISRSSPEGWPPRWKDVLGIAPTAPAADGLLVTVASS